MCGHCPSVQRRSPGCKAPGAGASSASLWVAWGYTLTSPGIPATRQTTARRCPASHIHGPFRFLCRETSASRSMPGQHDTILLPP